MLWNFNHNLEDIEHTSEFTSQGDWVIEEHNSESPHHKQLGKVKMDGVLKLDLQPGGDEVENNNFHTLDAYPGQVERSGVYDYGSDLNLQMNLVEVIHGTMENSPNSMPATLVIADFLFTSRDASRRFRSATIDLRFRELSPIDANPPEVFAIAPDGVFRMDKTERTQELTRSANANVGATFVANVSTGLEWSLTQTQTKYSSAKLTGVKTMKERNTEPKNVAMWSLHENTNDENGIPSLLRTAILLRRKKSEQFRCGVLVTAKVGLIKKIHLESRTAGGDIDPVLFDPNKERSTPVPPYIDPKNLGSVLLSKLMAIQSNSSVETVAVAQTNAIVDGHISGLTFESVMGKAKDPIPDSVDPKVSTSISAKGTRIAEEVKGTVSTSLGGERNVHDEGKSERTISSILGTQVPALTLQNGLNTGENASLEETMRLLLHAVRKGVEVIAESNRIKLEAWPEFIPAVAKDVRGENNPEKET